LGLLTTTFTVKLIGHYQVSESLDFLYALRARQLREKYDYLVLYFSGGADSTNILKTFIDNNIFLDEIVMQMA